MSLCAEYIKNPRNCNILTFPEQQQEQVIFNQRQNITKNFSLSSDATYYQISQPPNCQSCWTSSDPRLYDQVRGFKVCLDSPPLNLNIDKNLKNLDYPQKPQTYSRLEDIDLGDIKYYYNTSIQQPFNTVNFTTPMTITKKINIDPMTSVKPEYIRNKLIYSTGCDQETRDQLSFREDMIERLIKKQNQRLFL